MAIPVCKHSPTYVPMPNLFPALPLNIAKTILGEVLTHVFKLDARQLDKKITKFEEKYFENP